MNGSDFDWMEWLFVTDASIDTQVRERGRERERERERERRERETECTIVLFLSSTHTLSVKYKVTSDLRQLFASVANSTSSSSSTFVCCVPKHAVVLFALQRAPTNKRKRACTVSVLLGR